jgi:hypothetical protein
MKLLKQQPLADDVLDVVRHHGEHGGHEEKTKIPVLQRGKRDFSFRHSGNF